MTLTTYLLYLAAVAVLIATPGPTMLMCVANAVNHGRGPALAASAGALSASFAMMMLSALGLGALLATSEAAFTVMKFAGATYLIWLGIKTIVNDAPPVAATSPAGRARSFFAQGFLVGASNPKALIFFAAFFPQFIEPNSGLALQFLLLALTFVAGDALMMVAVTLGVARVAPRLREAAVIRWVNRFCGGMLALLGALLLFARRA